MKFEVDKSKCAGCGACLRACPHGAIKIGKDGKAFINQDKCKKCGECQKICPFDAIKEIPEETDKNIQQPRTSETSASAANLNMFSPADRKRPGLRNGRGMGMGRGRGLGRGPRDGRGGGRGGGGRKY